MFPDIPPAKAPPALVRSAQEPLKLPGMAVEGRLPEQKDAQKLAYELFEGPKDYVSKQVAISVQGLRSAEVAITEARAELARLTIFEYFSDYGTAAARQIRLDEARKELFSAKYADYSELAKLLRGAEAALLEGRPFEEIQESIKKIHRFAAWDSPLPEVLDRAAEIARLVAASK